MSGSVTREQSAEQSTEQDPERVRSEPPDDAQGTAELRGQRDCGKSTFHVAVSPQRLKPALKTRKLAQRCGISGCTALHAAEKVIVALDFGWRCSQFVFRWSTRPHRSNYCSR